MLFSCHFHFVAAVALLLLIRIELNAIGKSDWISLSHEKRNVNWTQSKWNGERKRVDTSVPENYSKMNGRIYSSSNNINIVYVCDVRVFECECERQCWWRRQRTTSVEERMDMPAYSILRSVQSTSTIVLRLWLHVAHYICHITSDVLNGAIE